MIYLKLKILSQMYFVQINLFLYFQFTFYKAVYSFRLIFMWILIQLGYNIYYPTDGRDSFMLTA